MTELYQPANGMEGACFMAAFCDRLGLGDGVADLCAQLHEAFRQDRPARLVIQLFASLALSSRPIPSRQFEKRERK